MNCMLKDPSISLLLIYTISGKMNYRERGKIYILYVRVGDLLRWHMGISKYMDLLILNILRAGYQTGFLKNNPRLVKKSDGKTYPKASLDIVNTLSGIVTPIGSGIF
jgi:hypothetical protein